MRVIPSNSIDALLFDLGGIIFEIDFNKVISRWAAQSGADPKTLKARFYFDSFYKQHERGEIGAKEYFDSLRKLLGIRLSDRQLEEGWNAVYGREMPGIRALLWRAGKKLPLYAFSNSNAAHHRVWAKKYAAVLRIFNGVFVSFQLGMRKPEPKAFRTIARSIGIKLSRIAFFDDTMENVKGARAIGMQAFHVKSTKDIKASLRQILR